MLGGCAAGLLLLVVTLLCGQNPTFSRTPLPRLHRLLLAAGGKLGNAVGCALLAPVFAAGSLDSGWKHHLITKRAPPTRLRCRAAARQACGRPGGACLHATGELCCERSNPAVQLLFVGLLGGCYWLFWSSIFPLLPLPGVPAWHKWVATQLQRQRQRQLGV